MGPKLMLQVGTTQGHAKMLKRIPAKDARSWRIEGQKRGITRNEYQRLLN